MATALAVSCDVCMLDFNEADRKSVALPCGHDFCLTCLVRLKTSGSHKCPKCRGDWAELEVEALSGMLVEVDDQAEENITARTTKKGNGLCKKHQLSYVFWYREHKEFFCNKCVVEMSSPSKLELIDDAIPEIKTELSKRVAVASTQIGTDSAEIDRINTELDGKLLQVLFLKEKVEELERGIGKGIKRVKFLKATNLNASVLVDEIETKIKKINSDLDMSTILESRAALDRLSEPIDLPSVEESKSLLCNIACSYAEATSGENCPTVDTFVRELQKASNCIVDRQNEAGDGTGANRDRESREHRVGNFSSCGTGGSPPTTVRSSSDCLDRSPESNKIQPLKKYVSEGPAVSLPKRTTFEEDWKRLQAMTLEDKRKLYSCRKFNTLQEIPTWTQYAKDNVFLLSKHKPNRKLFPNDTEYDFSAHLNEKVSIFVGDITSLEIDCIVNDANSSLLGGRGVDWAIHRAAGPSLLKECKTLGGCKTGEAKLSRGYKLPCNFIIHTVGPIDSNAADLYSSYFNSLQLAFLKKIRTIAFPCISTGIYGFPNEQAVSLVLPIIRKIFNRNPKQFDRIIFCLFMQQDFELYLKYMQVYFPIHASGAAAS